MGKKENVHECVHNQGCLSDTSLDNENYNQGFLSFLRLIGTIYYKKHATGFDSNSPESSYKEFYSNHSHLTVNQVHRSWLQYIQQNIWDRIIYESKMVPSVDALWRHWKRSCWIAHMWKQADHNDMQLLPIMSYGWKKFSPLIGTVLRTFLQSKSELCS